MESREMGNWRELQMAEAHRMGCPKHPPAILYVKSEDKIAEKVIHAQNIEQAKREARGGQAKREDSHKYLRKTKKGEVKKVGKSHTAW